jgi:hypothetical protein
VKDRYIETVTNELPGWMTPTKNDPMPEVHFEPERPRMKLSRILEPESWIVFAGIVSAVTVGGHWLIQALGWNL